MFYAKSAKACVALGATLVVFANPVIAADSSGNTAGIDGTGIAGIDGTGAAGIDGTGILGIDGTGINGIDGTGAAGIDGTGILGIDGTGIAGIDGTGAAGIDGTGINGIDGTGAAGIDGTGILGIDGTGIAGIDGTGAAGIDGTGVLLAGPVDSIDRINGVFESMGQVVMASQNMLSSMRVGDFVTVGGTAISSGWYYADTVSVSDQSYVPGATEVFISGLMSSVDFMNGTAQMGDLTIDYTASLGSSVTPSGELWSFHGTRPSLGGSMISTRTEGVN
jgi:hypothetical protein